MGNPAPDAEKLEHVLAVLRRLRGAGHEAWLNGGCVRDHLLGKAPKDFDVATSATPDQVEALFTRTIAVGKAFGVVRVGHRSDWFEVATFRRDGPYLDGRRPVSVTFSSAEEDAARRDFTINGMFWDPTTGEILDYVGGQDDVARRIVRAIGDADARFNEDFLRILRAVRFASQDGFTLDPATRDAVVRNAGKLREVAPERIREELLKIASSPPAVRSKAIGLLGSCQLLPVLFPEVPANDAPRAAEVAAASPTRSLPLFLAAILGRALPANARPHAWDALARLVASRLRLSNDETASLAMLLATRVRARGATRTGSARRRLLAALAGYPLLRELLRAEGGAADAVLALDDLRARFGEGVPPPLLDGRELLALGVPPRKAVGAWIRRLTVLGLSGRIVDKSAAEDYVKRRLAQSRA